MDKDDSRLDWTCKVLESIIWEARKNNVPLLFCGDLFHIPKEVDNYTLYRALLSLNLLGAEAYESNISMYAISGNHDLAEKNGLNHISPSHIKSMALANRYINCIDFTRASIYPGGKVENEVTIWGIPYMNNEAELKKAIKRIKTEVRKVSSYFKILMLHADAPGAEDFSGHAVEKTDAIPNLDKFFEPWDLVLMGHIHKPQKLSDKVYMLGSPIHQISSDRGEMGYWKIFNDQPPEFVGLEGFPKFRRLKAGKKPKNELDYWIPEEEESKVEEVEAGEFNVSQSRKKLAKKYLKAKGIKDKDKEKALINTLNQAE
jgi:DNA repair exonuclease SbcCD nuclease subunit